MITVCLECVVLTAGRHLAGQWWGLHVCCTALTNPSTPRACACIFLQCAHCRAVPCRAVTCCARGRRLAAAAITYLLAEDEDLEPENSRTALVLAPGKSPSVLDVAVVAAQKVRGARPPYPAARLLATHGPSPGAVGKTA